MNEQILEKIFDKKHVSHPEYYDYINNKEVIFVAPGINCLSVDNRRLSSQDYLSST